MAPFRDEKMVELIKHTAAKFLQENAGPNSLITITNAIWNEKAKTATIFFTAFPEDKEKTALLFAKRKLREFREYFKEHSRTRSIPFFDFEIDLGEKNRQRIDELSQEN